MQNASDCVVMLLRPHCEHCTQELPPDLMLHVVLRFNSAL